MRTWAGARYHDHGASDSIQSGLGHRSQNRNRETTSSRNLRWVSKSLNSWNCVRTDKRPSHESLQGVARRCPRTRVACSRN
jgi:hypothetical protein